MKDIVFFPSSNFNETEYVNIKEVPIIDCETTKELLKYYKKKKLILLKEYKPIPSILKKFSEGQGKIIIDLRKIIETKGIKRAKNIAILTSFIKICIKFDIPIILATFAKNKEDARTYREIVHIGTLLGLNIGQAKLALQQF